MVMRSESTVMRTSEILRCTRTWATAVACCGSGGQDRAGRRILSDPVLRQHLGACYSVSYADAGAGMTHARQRAVLDDSRPT